jgi:hypothetical protein
MAHINPDQITDGVIETEIARILESIEGLRSPYNRVPSVVQMRDNLRRTTLSERSPFLPVIGCTLLIPLFLMFVPFTMIHMVWLSWMLLITASGILLIALLMTIGLFCNVIPQALGLYLTQFLIARQHDRAVAGLRLVLKEGRPLIVYLREFENEETSVEFLALEHMLIDVAHNALMVIALLNPELIHQYGFLLYQRCYILFLFGNG